MLNYSYVCNMKVSHRNFTSNKLNAVAKIFKTIAHPVKLEILEILEAEEPLDVSTICERINSSCETSMMSHHLTKMKDNGILRSQKQGKQVFYTIADRQILSLFDCMDKCMML